MKPLALVVENDAGTRKLLEVLLTRSGYDVDLVAGAAEALILLGVLRYDALFVDLLLPASSGSEVIAWLGANRPDALPRTTVLSAAPPAQLERLRAQWPDIRVIRKPFDLTEVFDRAAQLAAHVEENDLGVETMFLRRSVIAGAKAGLIVQRNGERVELVTRFGYTATAVDPWFPMSVSDPYPICVAMRDARPVWLASLQRVEQFSTLTPVWQRFHSRSLASVPIVRGERVIGAAGWTFSESHIFTETEQQVFASIAADAAQAIQSAPAPPA